ncbi:MAG: hypothetical protein KAS95_03545 [Candidatus Heimdallarchaeota archaeon]|nr:hypothetical protein [Candidatus Heimdallarchaeota archaeon]
MKRKSITKVAMKASKFVLLLLYLTSFFVTMLSITAIGEPTTEYVILFDESHGQFFTRDYMVNAIEALNEMVTNISEDIHIKILYHSEGKFNSTNLQGVDLLIITNPGIEDEHIFTSSEIDAILDFAELGGSLFVLSNPLTQNESITGHPLPINELLSAKNDRLTSARIRRSSSNISHSTVIIDDYLGIYGNDSYLSITNYESSHVIFDQEHKIENITLYSTSILLGSEETSVAIGRTPITSYSVSDDYSIFRDINTGFLTWLFVKETGSSRLVISGSSIMFSDLKITEDETWVEQSQNLELWFNIVAWLLKLTPYEKVLPAVLSFQYFALTVVGLSVVIFSLSILIYKYRSYRRQRIIKS